MKWRKGSITYTSWDTETAQKLLREYHHEWMKTYGQTTQWHLGRQAAAVPTETEEPEAMGRAVDWYLENRKP